MVIFGLACPRYTLCAYVCIREAGEGIDKCKRVKCQ